MTSPFKKASTNGVATTQTPLIDVITTSTTRQELQDNLYPSSAGICVRRNVLALSQQHEQVMSFAGQVLTTIGTALHILVQRKVSAAMPNALIEYPVKLQKHRVSGRIDIITNHNGIELWDIKTTTKLPRQIKFHALRQLAVYSAITGIKKVGALYLSTVTGKMRRITVDFDKNPAARDLVRDIIAQSNVAYENGCMPPKLNSKTQCKFCPFIDDCWERKSFVTECALDYTEYVDKVVERRNDLEVVSKIVYNQIVNDLKGKDGGKHVEL